MMTGRDRAEDFLLRNRQGSSSVRRPVPVPRSGVERRMSDRAGKSEASPPTDVEACGRTPARLPPDGRTESSTYLSALPSNVRWTRPSYKSRALAFGELLIKAWSLACAQIAEGGCLMENSCWPSLLATVGSGTGVGGAWAGGIVCNVLALR